MKRFLMIVCAGFLFTAASIPAEETPVPVPAPIPVGMGTKIEMGTEIDRSAVDRSYLDAPDIANKRWSTSISIIRSLVWSPDGEEIIFCDMDNIYAVSARGGTPRLVMESYYIHPFEGKRYVLQRTIMGISGISPDGRNLYFTRREIGSGSGAVITISNEGRSVGVSGGISVLDCLDLQTGEIRTISRGVSTAAYSGRYIVFHDTAAKNTRIIDTVSLEEWTLPAQILWAGFTPNDYLLYSELAGTVPQLFLMPVRGGEPEQVTSISGGITGMVEPVCSPDGNWALSTVATGERYSNSITRPDGTKRSYSKGVMKLCAFDLRTGAVSDALPLSKSIDPRSARFSPDGKKFCYILENQEGVDFHQEWSIWIKDFPAAVSDSGNQLAVDDTTPLAFGLAGNYPNPFNPSTTISFTLSASGTVELSIYDITGRKVRDLVAGMRSAGTHAVAWDGRDAAGVTVSSGTYLARLKMGNRAASHRMLLVK